MTGVSYPDTATWLALPGLALPGLTRAAADSGTHAQHLARLEADSQGAGDDQQTGDAGDDAQQERRLGRYQACDHDDQTEDQGDEGDEGAPPMATSDVNTRNEPRIIVQQGSFNLIEPASVIC